jgi:ubiquinone/menaquinone biosynthesis C-methylase UbiE
MDSHSKLMQQEWADNSIRYRDPIGMTGRRPEKSEFNAMINDIHEKFDLRSVFFKQMLDIGCNNGYLIKELNPNAKEIVGVDFCRASLLEGKRLFSKAFFLQAEINNLPFTNNQFERVLCYSLFHYLPSEEAGHLAAKELLRVLAKNGKALIGDIFAKEFKHLIPRDEFLRWDSPNRPFMHRISNWQFSSLNLLETLLNSLNIRKVEIFPQNKEMRCANFRFDILLSK